LTFVPPVYSLLTLVFLFFFSPIHIVRPLAITRRAQPVPLFFLSLLLSCSPLRTLMASPSPRSFCQGTDPPTFSLTLKTIVRMLTMLSPFSPPFPLSLFQVPLLLNRYPFSYFISPPPLTLSTCWLQFQHVRTVTLSSSLYASRLFCASFSFFGHLHIRAMEVCFIIRLFMSTKTQVPLFGLVTPPLPVYFFDLSLNDLTPRLEFRSNHGITPTWFFFPRFLLFFHYKIFLSLLSHCTGKSPRSFTASCLRSNHLLPIFCLFRS